MTLLRDDLVGTWRLIAASRAGADGRPDSAPFGEEPRGVLTYTPATVMVIISHGERPLLPDGDRAWASESERAAAFSTAFAYAGRYEVAGDTVVHHVSIATVENWVGTAMVREAEIAGDRLVLRTPPIEVGGISGRFELLWERAVTI